MVNSTGIQPIKPPAVALHLIAIRHPHLMPERRRASFSSSQNVVQHL